MHDSTLVQLNWSVAVNEDCAWMAKLALILILRHVLTERARALALSLDRYRSAELELSAVRRSTTWVLAVL